MMKRVMRSVVFGILLLGGAVLIEDKSEACTNPAYHEDSCDCVSSYRGYHDCTTNGTICFLGTSGCGGGPGTLPP